MTARDRRLRADAQRNRERILDAARRLFAEQGGGAQMDAIARDAGVAVGTLYRHFPTKEALLEAALLQRVDRLGEQAARTLERIEGGADAWEEFSALLRSVAAAHEEDRAFKAAAAAGGVALEYERAAADVLALLQQIVDQTAKAGRLRPDVTPQDLWLLLAGLPGPEFPPEVRARHLDIVLAGLGVPSDA